MAGLTVTEKGHWIDRIKNKIDNKIEKISAEDPDFFEKLKRDSLAMALESLGLTETSEELAELEKLEEAQKSQREKLQEKRISIIRNCQLGDLKDNYGYNRFGHYGSEVDSAINKRARVHSDELMAADEKLGQRVLRLKEEKDNLLDTVWLATSSKQIKELWEQVSELLGDENTPLQQDALMIDPVED